MTEAIDEPNPYAAPRAAIQLPTHDSGPAVFYPMSPAKAALMSVLTFSMYDVLFWYRHWTRMKEGGQDVSPIPRAIFAVFTAFEFVTTLQTVRVSKGLGMNRQLGAAPGVYILLKLLGRISDRVGDRLFEPLVAFLITVVACASGAWVLATVQARANEVLAADDYRGPTNSGVTWGAALCGLCGLLVWVFAVIGAVSPEALEE